MGYEVIKSFYNPRRRLLKLSIKVVHGTYGPVVCVFELTQRREEKFSLSNVFVENAVIPLQEHKELLSEIKCNINLMDEALRISREEIENKIAILEKKRLDEVGGVTELTLDYVMPLGSSSIYSNEISRDDSELSKTTESKFERHTLYVMVKFNELEYEYELTINYNSKKGYKVKSNTTNRDKPSIKEYLDNKTSMEIITAARDKVEFLP